MICPYCKPPDNTSAVKTPALGWWHCPRCNKPFNPEEQANSIRARERERKAELAIERLKGNR